MKKVKIEVSPRFSLNRTDWKSIGRSALIFFAGILLIYINQVTGTIAQTDHVFSIKDFIPSSFTYGAITAYVLGQLTNIIRKYIAQ